MITAVASAITEQAFVTRRRRAWDELDSLSRKVLVRGLKTLTVAEVARVSPLYRDVCGDLAAAMAARYSAPLVDYLQGLVASAHTVLYGPFAAIERRVGAKRGLRAWTTAFPRAVRRHWRPMLISFALFFLPLAGGLIASLIKPDLAFRVVPESMLRPLTEAYQEGFDKGRAVGENALMMGFYVQHNIGIALRCFALGIFGGLGSAFYLVENGFSIGAVLGYVASQGAGDNIFTFIVGHSSLELGACVIAGGAGLAMGWSVVAPGEKTRLASLQHVAKDLVVVIVGTSVMLLGAATIEGFWSASSLPSLVKRIVGATMFMLVLGYISLAGRGQRDVSDRRDRKESPR